MNGLNQRCVVCLIGMISLLPRFLGAEEVQFVDVTAEAGIRFRHMDGASGRKYFVESMCSGGAFLDYNNDGYQDIYLVNGAPLPGFEGGHVPRNALYRNKGDGTFTEVTEEAGVGDAGYGYGVTAADYDNDGDVDLYLANFGPNVLYRNNGDGTFTDVTREAGVGDTLWATNAVFADYDNDGDVDLYVGNYVHFTVETHKVCGTPMLWLYCHPSVYPGVSDVLYRNNGDGTFTDVTREAGVFNPRGKAMGVVFGDYDNDGDVDLYVANDTVAKFLYRNNGNGTFTEVGLIAGVAYSGDGRVQAGMGADFGDYDNDGDLDIFVATYQMDHNTLYRNDGNGLFTDVTFEAKLGRESLMYLGFGTGFLDYDNDGDLDIFIADGHLEPDIVQVNSTVSYAQTNQLFRNEGDGTFSEVSDQAGPGLKIRAVSRCCVFGDYDNDGDLDILVTNRNSTPNLLRNDGGNRNHWLMIQAVGTKSNRDGIGARIKVVSGSLVQIKEVRSSSGYMGQNDMRVHFGLGHRDTVDMLEIRWPSGVVQRLRDVAVDRVLTVMEPGGREQGAGEQGSKGAREQGSKGAREQGSG